MCQYSITTKSSSPSSVTQEEGHRGDPGRAWRFLKGRGGSGTRPARQHRDTSWRSSRQLVSPGSSRHDAAAPNPRGVPDRVRRPGGSWALRSAMHLALAVPVHPAHRGRLTTESMDSASSMRRSRRGRRPTTRPAVRYRRAIPQCQGAGVPSNDPSHRMVQHVRQARTKRARGVTTEHNGSSAVIASPGQFVLPVVLLRALQPGRQAGR